MANENIEVKEKSLNFLEEIIEESIANGLAHVQTQATSVSSWRIASVSRRRWSSRPMAVDCTRSRLWHLE